MYINFLNWWLINGLKHSRNGFIKNINIKFREGPTRFCFFWKSSYLWPLLAQIWDIIKQSFSLSYRFLHFFLEIAKVSSTMHTSSDYLPLFSWRTLILIEIFSPSVTWSRHRSTTTNKWVPTEKEYEVCVWHV